MNNLVWKYVKVISDKNTIKDFEKLYGIKIPADIKVCITNNNGGVPNKKIFDSANDHDHVFNRLLSYNHDDRTTVYDSIEYFQSNGLNLLPIASDPFGNYICLDIKKSNIVMWFHETEEISYICKNFTDFLNSLRDDTKRISTY